jgi:ankyrin repeat protein
MADRGYQEVEQLLLASGADVNTRTNGDSLWPTSCSPGEADVNAEDQEAWTPLHWAADRGFSDIAELLLAHNADVNAKGEWRFYTPTFAASLGYKEMVQLLLANAADVNARDDEGATPLKVIVVHSRKDTEELLRHYGSYE